MSKVAARLRTAIPSSGIRIHIWPVEKGYQVNVSTDGVVWQIDNDADPVLALDRLLARRTRAVSVADPMDMI